MSMVIKAPTQEDSSKVLYNYQKETGLSLEALRVASFAFAIIAIISCLALAGHYIPSLSSFTHLMGFLGAVNISAPVAALSFTLAIASLAVAIHQSRVALKKLKASLEENELIGSKINTLKTELVSITAQTEEKNKEFNRLSGEISELKKESEEEGKKVTELVTSATKLRFEFEKTEKEYKAKSDQLDNLKKNISRAKNQLKSLTQSIGDKFTEIEGFEKQSASLIEDISKKQTEKNELSEQILILSDQKNKLKKDIMKLIRLEESMKKNDPKIEPSSKIKKREEVVDAKEKVCEDLNTTNIGSVIQDINNTLSPFKDCKQDSFKTPDRMLIYKNIQKIHTVLNFIHSSELKSKIESIQTDVEIVNTQFKELEELYSTYDKSRLKQITYCNDRWESGNKYQDKFEAAKTALESKMKEFLPTAISLVEKYKNIAM